MNQWCVQLRCLEWAPLFVINPAGEFEQAVCGMNHHLERQYMLDTKNPASRKEELRSFAFLTVVMAPVLAGLIVAAYGFMVWIYQMFAGPPHA